MVTVLYSGRHTASGTVTHGDEQYAFPQSSFLWYAYTVHEY
jgi:hypothetical protein